jgi:hypothetical protein
MTKKELMDIHKKLHAVSEDYMKSLKKLPLE